MIMKNRNKETAPFENLDSFLDTLFNVAGVLIIFLIMIQLSASSMMKTMNNELKNKQTVMASINSSREKLTKESARNTQTKKEISSLADVTSSMQTNVNSQKKELSTSEIELSASTKALKKSLHQLGFNEGKNNASEINRRGDQAKKYAELNEELMTKLKEFSAAQRSLNDTRLTVSSQNEIRVPIPRDPPIGSKGIWFYCRYGKIASLKSSQPLIKQFREKVQPLAPFPLEGSFSEIRRQARLIKEHFGVNPISNDYMYLDFSKVGYFSPRVKADGKGDDEKTILTNNSLFKVSLNNYDSGFYHLKFLVWEDSFPVYLEARAIADKLGYKCGWEPITNDRDSVISLNRGLYPVSSFSKNID